SVSAPPTSDPTETPAPTLNMSLPPRPDAVPVRLDEKLNVSAPALPVRFSTALNALPFSVPASGALTVNVPAPPGTAKVSVSAPPASDPTETPEPTLNVSLPPRPDAEPVRLKERLNVSAPEPPVRFSMALNALPFSVPAFAAL